LKIIYIPAIFLFLFNNLQASEVTVNKNKQGWRMLVDGEPFFIKGVCYNPTIVGESPDNNTMRDWMVVDDDKDGQNDIAFQSWVDKNLNNKRDPKEIDIGDFELLKNCGCNAIRIYHHASDDSVIQSINPGRLLFNHAPNKELLRKLHQKYGIWVAMGDLMGAYTVASGANWEQGTDYTDAVQKQNMKKSIEEMVLTHKDEPYLLLWILGNENNFKDFTKTNASEHPVAYAQFVNEMAILIHKLDPHHPVALCNGETHFISTYAEHAPDIDIFGINSYRRLGFDDLWIELSEKYDKPVMLTEYGTLDPKFQKGLLDENNQAKIHEAAWIDIWEHKAGAKPPGNAIGGFAFRWLDRWIYGKPDGHGFASQGNGKHSPFLRRLRKTYFTYQNLWNQE